MAVLKYIYNPRTLAYEKVELSTPDRIKKAFVFTLTGSVFAAGFIVCFYTFFDSPKEKLLKREIEQLTLQYDILNERSEQISSILGDLEKRDDNIYRVIFEAEPIPNQVREAGFGGINRYKKLQGFEHTALMIEVTQKLDILLKKLYVQSKSFDQVFEMSKNKAEMLAAIPAIQPLANKDLTRVASGYGERIHPIYKTVKMHTGMDYTAPSGTDIYSTGNGIVTVVEKSITGYGNHVIIDHGYGYQTLYAHMSEVNINQGQNVKRGEVIGHVGNSGSSIGPHLHYEVLKNGIKINPINFYYNDLTPAEYDKMIELSSKANQSFD